MKERKYKEDRINETRFEGSQEKRVPDFMNCAELHLNENNLPNYLGENLYFYRPGDIVI